MKLGLTKPAAVIIPAVPLEKPAVHGKTAASTIDRNIQNTQSRLGCWNKCESFCHIGLIFDNIP